MLCFKQRILCSLPVSACWVPQASLSYWNRSLFSYCRNGRRLNNYLDMHETVQLTPLQTPKLNESFNLWYPTPYFCGLSQCVMGEYALENVFVINTNDYHLHESRTWSLVEYTTEHYSTSLVTFTLVLWFKWMSVTCKYFPAVCVDMFSAHCTCLTIPSLETNSNAVSETISQDGTPETTVDILIPLEFTNLLERLSAM